MIYFGHKAVRIFICLFCFETCFLDGHAEVLSSGVYKIVADTTIERETVLNSQRCIYQMMMCFGFTGPCGMVLHSRIHVSNAITSGKDKFCLLNEGQVVSLRILQFSPTFNE